jgi:[acyl-carrier-protein] S-malonyltransferase
MKKAILQQIEKTGVKPDVCAGLSLGEYGALIASGVMSMEDAFRVVRARGIFKQELHQPSKSCTSQV